MATLDTPFAAGDSPIHRIDPRVRLVSALFLTIPVALFTQITTAALALCLGIVLTLVARLDLREAGKRLAVVNFFTAFLWLFLPFATPGDAIAAVGPLSLTRQGLELALLVTLKTNGITLALMALMGTVPVQQLGPALHALKTPPAFCHLFMFTYRYIFVIHHEYQTMRRAMAVRGFRPKTDRRTYRAFAWLVGMLLVKSWDRAERVQAAMRCRGFRGRFHCLDRFALTPADRLFLVVVLFVAAGLCFLELNRSGVI